MRSSATAASLSRPDRERAFDLGTLWRRSVLAVAIAFSAPLLCVTLVAALATGCGARGGASARSSPRAGNAWAGMTWEDRHDSMTFLVLPNMARLFQHFEGSAYPTMTCRTCHGPDAEAARYRMPHGLPPLDPARLPDGNDPDPQRARLARFMIDDVTPQMAELLGVPQVDPSGHGFSCFGCHPARANP